MTALIYKAALPTYTSLADLNANAGESLLLNDAGTAYELEPAQSGAYVPGTDSISVYCDFSATQTIPDNQYNGAGVLTTMTFDTPEIVGDSFAAGTKGVHVLAGTLVAGNIGLGFTESPVADTTLTLWVGWSDGDGTGEVGFFSVRAKTMVTLPAGWDPTWLALPFTSVVHPTRKWLSIKATACGAPVVLDDFGGFYPLWRLA